MAAIQVGYGSDTRPKPRKNAYGGVSRGKVKHNGGFSGEPTVSFEKIDEKEWARIFGDAGVPWYEKRDRVIAEEQEDDRIYSLVD